MYLYKRRHNTNKGFTISRCLIKMTQFRFEGDFQNLGEPQINLVESVLQKHGYNEGTVIVEPVGQKGDSIIAFVKRFIYRSKDGSTFKMIGKIPPVAEELRMGMNIPVLFNNETIMYNEVIPKFKILQTSAGVTENDGVRFPICYGVATEAPFEFILLEDLKESGLEMLNRFKMLSNDNLRTVLKGLARYHSLSFVLKHTEPEAYKSITDRMLNMWTEMMDAPGAQLFMEMTENDLVKLVHDSNNRYTKVIKGSLTQISPLAKKMSGYEIGSKYSVIQHGDCWINNILFQLEDAKPVQTVMIDYQMSRESNPAADILNLLFSCTDHASRLNHYPEWINYYHKCLEDSLDNYGLKANLIFSRDQLDADLRRYGRLIVNVALMGATMLVRENEDVVDFKEETDVADGAADDIVAQMSIAALRPSTVAKLKEKIMGIIDTAVEFGLISL